MIREKHILAALDYGTVNYDVKYRIVVPGAPLTPESIKTISFADDHSYEEQKIAYDKKGKLYCGSDVTNREKSFEDDEVIVLLKLLFYDGFRGHQVCKISEKQLEKIGKTANAVLTDQLTVIIKKVKEIIKSDTVRHIYARVNTADCTLEEIKKMPIYLIMTVPQMWPRPAYNRMSAAAKRTKLVKGVNLVPEPVAAAAYFAFNLKNRLSIRFNVNDIVLIADVGGGTGDFVTFKYLTSGDAGAAVRLEIVGSPQGVSCGSELVTQRYLEWFEAEIDKEHKGIDHLRRNVDKNLTMSSLLKDKRKEFEIWKETFDGVDRGLYIAAVGRSETSDVVRLRFKEMKSFFDEAIDKISEAIEFQLEPVVTSKVKAIILPGGFCANKYVMMELKERFRRLAGKIFGRGDQGIVRGRVMTEGALLRYEDIGMPDLPSTDSFGIGRTEIFNPMIHPDAVHVIPEGPHRGGFMNKEGMVSKDKFDGKDNVEERWASIPIKDESDGSNDTFTASTWLQHQVRPGVTGLDRQIYWSQNKLAENAPIFDGPPANNQLMPGIHRWDDIITLKLPNLKKKGYELKPEGVYEIFTRLAIVRNGANDTLKWELASPQNKLYNASDEFEPPMEIHVGAKKWEPIIDTDFYPETRCDPFRGDEVETQGLLEIVDDELNGRQGGAKRKYQGQSSKKAREQNGKRNRQ